MSERSEFSGPPADNVRSEGTPKGRRGGRASLLTFLSRDKKVSRPPGRNPGRSRSNHNATRINLQHPKHRTPSVHSRTERRSEEHTSDSSHVRISYAVFCLKKKNKY